MATVRPSATSGSRDRQARGAPYSIARAFMQFTGPVQIRWLRYTVIAVTMP
jgi:hypothetical protein